MPSYAGVSFDEIMTDPIARADWSQSVAITERLIPYANQADVQSAGRGNFRITVLARLSNAGDLATLQAAQGATRRTLTSLFGDTHTNVLLVEIGEARRYRSDTKTLVELTFIRAGS